MNPSALQLAKRDPALAMLLGGIPRSQSGAADFGADFGDDWAGDDVGVDFGDDMGADFGAAAAAPMARVPAPSQAQLHAMWRNRHAAKAHTQHRERLIEPNKGSSTKVERYSFTISQAITLGTAVALSITGQPDTTIRPQSVTMNAPTPLYAFITELKVANVSVSVGSGFEDAYNYNANGVGRMLDMPTLSPANRATVLGSYTGFLPPGFVGGTATYFSVSLKGPATIVA